MAHIVVWVRIDRVKGWQDPGVRDSSDRIWTAIRGSGKGRSHHTRGVVERNGGHWLNNSAALTERISAQLMPMKYHEEHRNPTKTRPLIVTCFSIVHTKNKNNVFS